MLQNATPAPTGESVTSLLISYKNTQFGQLENTYMIH